MLPGRWQPVREFFDLVMAPLIEAGNAGYFAIERNGPDGKKWIVLRPESVELQAEDPALEATRLVSILCGASQGNVDPSPAGQGGCGIHYTAAALCTPKRDDKHAVALGAIVLDIDDKNVGGRAGCMAALTRIPEPSFVVHSGGGLQVGYVLREALLFDRSDDGAMRDTVYGYVRAANALGCLAGADATHWPSHLFRSPGAYHLKQKDRPVLVTCELHPERRFNLADFDDLAAASTDATTDFNAAKLLARLRGETLKAAPRTITPPPVVNGVVRVPRRVSAEMRELLSYGRHTKYTRPDGTLDRSRATYAAAISLLAAGMTVDEALGLLCISALRPAVDDRGPYGEDWLVGQVTKAEAAAKVAALLAEGLRPGSRG